MRVRYWLGTSAFFTLLPGLAFAGETTLYRYDSLGRLVEVTQSGSINNGVNTDIDYDAAGNRINYEVTGSNGAGSDGGVTGGVGDGSGGGGPGGTPTPTETPPSFSVNDTGGTEGQNMVFTITKTGSVQNSYTVSWFTSNGSALSGSDYTAVTGSHTFSGAQTTFQVSVPTVDDSAVEQSEAFYLNLNGTSGGATISDAQGAAIISDNDTPVNQPPTANNDTVQVNCGNGFAYPLNNDTDPEGDSLTIISATVTTGSLTAQIIAGSTVWISNASAGGAISYVVRDAPGATDT
ncbi:MAG: Calx-beta domain-containing protein, partial [Pseudomonadota bacterium]